ncbi:MAG: DUF6293 family protein [Euryarchaeota archaeon]|nr:DUF6293 family protein [Euryarchaeota archaeon]
MRVLICTFGFDDGKIIEAIRSISHDELYIVTGVANLEQDSYLRLVELSRALSRKMETVTTDIFDLSKSFETVVALVKRLKNEGKDVKMNISGGLPLLTDAALLAAFSEGIVTYYVNDGLLQLPVLKNVTIDERLTKDQKDLIVQIGGGKNIDDLDLSTAHRSVDVKRVLLELRKIGLIKVVVNDGKGWVSHTYEGDAVHRWLLKTGGR